MKKKKIEKQEKELYTKCYIGTMADFDRDEPLIYYMLFAYSPIHTSLLVGFKQDEKYYYFETLNSIYKVEKQYLINVSFKNQLAEFEKYLKSNEFKYVKKEYGV